MKALTLFLILTSSVLAQGYQPPPAQNWSASGYRPTQAAPAEVPAGWGASDNTPAAPAGWGAASEEPAATAQPTPAPPRTPVPVSAALWQPIDIRAPIKTIATCRKHWDYYALNGDKETVYADQLPPGMTAGDVLEARLKPRGITIDWSNGHLLTNTYPGGYPPRWYLPTRLQSLKAR